MTRYKHKLGGTEFDVVEKTIHLHIVSRDRSGSPTEIQVHRIREWYLNGDLIRTDQPIAAVLPLADLLAAQFANTGLSLMQALAVLDAVVAPYTPILVSGTEPVHDPIPEHATSAVTELMATISVHEATLAQRTAEAQTAQDNLNVVQHQLAEAREQLDQTKARAVAMGEQLEAGYQTALAQQLELDRQIAEKQATVTRLDTAIREKSAQSTKLTIEGDNSHGLPEN